MEIINEIRKIDRMFAKMNDTDLEATNIFREGQDIVDILMRSNSPARNAGFKHLVQEAIDKLKKIEDTDFHPNKSSKKLLRKASVYRQSLEEQLLQIP